MKAGGPPGPRGGPKARLVRGPPLSIPGKGRPDQGRTTTTWTEGKLGSDRWLNTGAPRRMRQTATGNADNPLSFYARVRATPEFAQTVDIAPRAQAPRGKPFQVRYKQTSECGASCARRAAGRTFRAERGLDLTPADAMTAPLTEPWLVTEWRSGQTPGYGNMRSATSIASNINCLSPDMPSESAVGKRMGSAQAG